MNDIIPDVPRCGKCGRYPVDHRGGECVYPPRDGTADVYRGALELVREALDIPHAKTAAGDEVRTEILHARVNHVTVMIDAVLGRAHPEWSIKWAREQIARHPADGYERAEARP